jgi:preprotein translocase subunit SecE
MKRLARFFVSIKNEMKNVKWPTRKEMVKYSVATLFFIVTFAVFFGLTDLLISGLKVWLG